jgi:hypothetical protein
VGEPRTSDGSPTSKRRLRLEGSDGLFNLTDFDLLWGRRSQKLDATRDDLSAVLLATVDLGFVFAGAQTTLDKHLATFLKILVAGKCELTDDHARSRVKVGEHSIGVDTDQGLVTNRTKGCDVRFLAVHGG